MERYQKYNDCQNFIMSKVDPLMKCLMSDILSSQPEDVLQYLHVWSEGKLSTPSLE